MSNTSFSATELLTYANLQIAAEALYGKLKASAVTADTLMTSQELDVINKNLTAEDPKDGFLTDGNKHTSKFSPTQAEQFAKD